MLARGITDYRRPGRIEDALRLVRDGALPLAGGTRLLATASEAPRVVDLAALGLHGIEMKDDDLELGALATLQDVADSPLAQAGSAGLLPLACRTAFASRLLRGMATVGGESIQSQADSEVGAALLALNAVYVVEKHGGTLEIPALRFLRDPRADVGDGLLTRIVIPGTPSGVALERIAVLPSAPSLISVAVSLSFTGDIVSRARIAITGLLTRPARVLEAELRLEGSNGQGRFLEGCLDQIQVRAPFRDDAHAPAEYRRKVVRVLARRALETALRRGRGLEPPPPLQRPLSPPAGPVAPLDELGEKLSLTLNGRPHEGPVRAGTPLLQWLRDEGLVGAKHGCESGECGACAVLLDGRPVVSCLTLAARAQGRRVDTVEGLGNAASLDPVQQAFVDGGAIQCGYCTPAMELVARSLLDTVKDPSEAEVREVLAGCLCRCTGYVKPVAAVLEAARSGA
jgi:aerobic-type carbon monoxide dehydrogenase small subunit (CoxS/CutS family)/CO/xanthine dehydrogenase FAD-binding subunit